MRRRVDPVGLVFGLAFITFGVVCLVGKGSWVAAHLNLLWPLALIVLGFAVMIGARRGDRSHDADVS